jgi:hypothetical protein
MEKRNRSTLSGGGSQRTAISLGTALVSLPSFIVARSLEFANFGLVCTFRFDARKVLEMLRGKRLVFAGDSLNRNQWESMMCLLRQAVSDPSRIREARGRRITKKKGDYNFKFLVRMIWILRGTSPFTV